VSTTLLGGAVEPPPGPPSPVLGGGEDVTEELGARPTNRRSGHIVVVSRVRPRMRVAPIHPILGLMGDYHELAFLLLCSSTMAAPRTRRWWPIHRRLDVSNHELVAKHQPEQAPFSPLAASAEVLGHRRTCSSATDWAAFRIVPQ